MIFFFLEFILFKSTGLLSNFIIFHTIHLLYFVLFWGIFHECISKIPIDFLKSLQSKFNLIFSPEFLLIVKCFLLHFKCFDLVLDFSPLMTLG